MADTTTTVVASKTAGKGRPVSPVTVAIRKLVKQKKGDVTFSVAKPLLEAQGVDVSGDKFESKFNMAKYLFVKNQTGKGVDWAVKYSAENETVVPTTKKRAAKKAAALPPKKYNPVVVEANDFAAATKLVESLGGVAKAKASLDARRAELDRDAALVAAFENGLLALSKLAA